MMISMYGYSRGGGGAGLRMYRLGCCEDGEDEETMYAPVRAHVHTLESPIRKSYSLQAERCLKKLVVVPEAALPGYVSVYGVLEARGAVLNYIL